MALRSTRVMAQKEHMDNIQNYGPCPIHRKSFDKVMDLMLPFKETPNTNILREVSLRGVERRSNQNKIATPLGARNDNKKMDNGWIRKE